MRDVHGRPSGPVFWDPTGRRWRWTVTLFFAAAVFCMVVLGFAAGELFTKRANDLETPPGTSAIEHIYSARPVSKNVRSVDDGSTVLGFVDSSDPNSLASLARHGSYLDSVVVDYGRMSASGLLIRTADEEDLEDALSVVGAHERSISVLASFSVGVGRPVRLSSVMRSAILREFDGIHLDFSGAADLDPAAAVASLRSLGIELGLADASISAGLAATVSTGTLAAVASAANQVVLMPTADASPIHHNLAAVQGGRVVYAIGAFGRDSSDRLLSVPAALKTAELFEADVAYSPTGMARFSYKDADMRIRRVEFRDGVTAFNQLSAASRPDGWAVWRLGLEPPEVWTVIGNRGDLDADVAESLSRVESEPGVTYVGSGEALAYAGAPRTGRRRISYSKDTDTVRALSLQEIPRATTIRRYGGSGGRTVAITFDDGPEPPHTPKILSILEEHGVKATFFVSGINAIRYPGLVKRIYNEGHEIGHHTFTHPNISRISARRFRLELRTLQVFIESLIGRRLVLFRPPYSQAAEPRNARDAAPLELLTDEGYILVTAYLDPRDWEGKSADEIQRLSVELARAEQGQVLLLHDGGGDRTATTLALPGIIEGIESEGIEIVPLSEHLGLDRAQVMPAISDRRAVLTRAYLTVLTAVGAAFPVVGALFGLCIALGMSRSLLMIVLSLVGKARQIHSGDRQAPNARRETRASVIVPAYNEEKVVCMTVDSLLDSDHPNFEIIVVDDGSSDATYDVLMRTYANHPKVCVFSVPNGGKSAALNFGIARSTGEVVVTLDADTIFARKTLANLVAPFADPTVGAVAGNAKVGNRDKAITRCQALEYITGQNIEKRAYDVINGISVVPGAVGAWRKSVLTAAGGLAHDTLAEDAELTFRILRSGHRVVYRDDAPGYTEAPDTVRSFVKQRVRWMYGTLQTAWKHRDVTFRPKFKALGVFTAPSIYLFQLFFPLFSIIVELMLLSNVGFHLYQLAHHPGGETASLASLQVLLLFYLLFLGIEFAMCLVAFLMEPGERKALLIWVVIQRFYYRPILSFVALRTLYLILRGRPLGWNKLERTGTVRVDAPADEPEVAADRVGVAG